MTKHYSLGFFPLSRSYSGVFSLPWWKHYLHPKTYWRTLKYFCQRGWRGYAECDYWDADNYMECVILGVMKDLKANLHGFPGVLSDHTGREFDHEIPESHDSGEEKWNKILEEIIEGLEASRELIEENTIPKGVYSEEPIEWERVKEGSDDLWAFKDTGHPRFNEALYESWAEPLRKKRKRARMLLIKWWGCFWD